MKKKAVLIIVLTLLSTTTVLPVVGTMNIKMEDKTLTDGPVVEWTKYYEGDEFDQFRCVKQTNDGGYIAFGEYEEDHMTYARLMKLDSDGEEVWSVINHDINGTGYDVEELMDYVIQTSDGGYLASGYSMYYYTEGEEGFWYVNGFLWKTDSDGDTEWLKYYYDEDEILWLEVSEFTEVNDGYVGGGMCVDFVSLDQPDYTLDFTIQKVDFDGNLVWYEQYDLGGYEIGLSFDLTDDGGYFLSGLYSENNILFDDDDFCMIKIDSNRDMEWSKTFDGPLQDDSPTRGCCQTNDGGYMMCGMTESYHAIGGDKWDIWQIKTDSEGNKEWENFFGGEGFENCWSMQKTSDGGYILAIAYNIGGPDGTVDDIYLVKTDEIGNVIWSIIIEEDDRQVPIFINETNDGGFIIGCRTGPGDLVSTDSFLMKLSSFDNQRPIKPTIDGPPNGKPDKSYTFKATSSDPDGGDLTYMWDWDDGNFSGWISLDEKAYTWVNTGNYEIKVKVKDEAGGESEWSDPFTFIIKPRNRAITLNSLMVKILERFPLIERILNIQ